ncbi:homoserine dehydrogenase [Clostridiaceae bacterium]|nr:homoserine dehydrogenase [Clostridiaceae bacterium]RKI10587.1 homoserine dehydrogenase [bacterium 1XD21-70]
MMYAAIMGYGTIGSGVAQILLESRERIARCAGQEIGLKYVLDLREFPDSPVADRIVHDFRVIEEDRQVRLVVEAMGGLNPAYPFVKACLNAGKHVVTSNKALVAAHGTELLQIARDKGVNFFFEASVGGGIPIIRTLYRCLMGEGIREITGILNGTTNFILTKMDREGASFDEVLREAQELGYAEQNPQADVEGHDTCRKIAILTAMVTGKEVNYEDISTEGITRITDMDFCYAKELGASVKLLGSSRIVDGKVYVRVAPVMIGREHPLHAVCGVYNGILVKSDMLGTSMYYGSGAGKLPTASAVVADLIEAAQNEGINVPIGWGAERQEIADNGTSKSSYFVRIFGDANEKAKAVQEELGEVRTLVLEGADEFAVLTREMSEAEFTRHAIALDSKWQKDGEDGIRQIIRTELEG